MMGRNRWMLVGFCGVMVLSALVSAVRRQQVVPGEPVEQHEPVMHVPESRFSPRQRPVDEYNPARTYSEAIADAVEKVMCSVVVIRTGRQQKVVRPIIPGWGRVEWEELMGEGSGIIIDENGYVLTSWHVIDKAEFIEIVLNDGTKLPAHEIGHDKATDLAVLKFEPKKPLCPAVEFGDSDKVRVGEVAIAIGSPFSLQSSVTVGHISQKGRRVQILPYEDFIQTDAAINEGNSGGPLIDVDGRLIGVNAAVKTEAEKKGVGIAFAIPVNLAVSVANSIIEKKRHEWPWVGCFFQSTGTEYKGIYDGASVVISDVFADTPAARASLQPGTAVFAVDGIPVKDEYDVKRIIFNKSVGKSIKLLLLLNEQKQEVELELEEFPGITLY
ncbi:Putative serine protease HtrA [Pontiella desulfatans]|uniref:Serine protease HtrA n=1 Tax=Pontiella desulfatans TaxID=2750659 RepID=A0A6C2U9Y7_PONDE|nr:trypsin-like peptidase domain-containing protein [Pontiella desulfatans]VGO16699.1 Putative serine protease HtrA [Pontiella desulfatans]